MTQREGFAADYIQVHERVAAFYAKFPDGSLQSELVELSESRVVMRGLAYRTPDDPRPGIGFSSLEIPGRTPYTRGSEIENCETSAWGRAIAALGFEVKRGIATAEEVRSKSAEGPAVATPPPTAGAQAAGRTSLRPAASTLPPEPEWLAQQIEHPAPAPGAAAAGSDERMTMRELFGAAEAAGIDKSEIGHTAKKLYGKGLAKDLDDEQRAVVWSELRR